VALAHKAMWNMDEAVRTMQRACYYETPWNEANKEEVRTLCASLEKERESSKKKWSFIRGRRMEMKELLLTIALLLFGFVLLFLFGPHHLSK
jgi:hypothetical protein